MIIDSPIISGSLASTGSLTQIGNVVITGSLSVSGPIKGNITGSADSASFATTSSYAVSASFATTAVTSSYPLAVTGSVLYSINPAAGVPLNPASSNNSIFLGCQAGICASAANNSNFIGQNAGANATNANISNFIGWGAGELATNANISNFIGLNAGYSASNASNSNFIGTGAGNSATNAGNSVFIGANAGVGATNASLSNFIGQSAGSQAASASYSLLIGYQAGYNAAGGACGIKSNNIIIGTNISLPDGTRDSINLGAIIFATGSYSSNAGNPITCAVGNGKVGINKSLPTYNLDVSGSGNYTNGLTVTGSIVATSVTSSLLGTASYAVNANFLDNLDSTSFVYTSSYNVDSSSFSTRVTNTEATASSLVTASGSFSNRVTIIESSYATTGSNLFSGTQGINNIANAISFTSTASLYTDGGARITKDLYVSGTSYFNNVTIYGTQSVQYITSSQLNIGTNIITVNTDTPTVRYGGIAVYDSGSTGLTGSMLWDSEANHWIYTNPSGSTYSGGMMISGPRSSARGCEQGTTSCALMMGQGGDHITSSAIFHYGNATCFYNNTVVGSGGTVCTTMANASCVGIGTMTPATTLDVSYTSAPGDIIHIAGANNVNGYIGAHALSNGGLYINSNQANQDIRLRTQGTDRLLIDSNGNAVIGSLTVDAVGSTTSLTLDRSAGNGQLSLAANGTVRGRIFADNSTSEFRIGNPTSNALMLYTANVERLRLTADGIACFACQVCAPTAVFTKSSDQIIRVETTSVTDNARIDFITPSKCYTIQNLQTGAANALIFYDLTAASERMRISSAGNVGIGTTSPINSSGYGGLSLNGTSGALFSLMTNGTETGRIASLDNETSIQSKATTGYITFVQGVSGGIERMRITSCGNVGIGITCDNPIVNGGTFRNLLLGNGEGYGAFQGVSTATAVNCVLVSFSGGTTGASGYKNAGAINVELDGSSTTNATGRLGFYTGVGGGIQERLRIASTGIACFACQICTTSAALSGNVIFNRANTSAGNNIEWRTASTLNWYIGTRGLVNNSFYFVNEGLGANNLILDATTGVATFACSVTANGSLTINEDGGGTKVLTVRSNWAGVDPAINVTTNNCLLLMTNNTVRVCLSNTGIATFACQVCAPYIVTTGQNIFTKEGKGTSDFAIRIGPLAYPTEGLFLGHCGLSNDRYIESYGGTLYINSTGNNIRLGACVLNIVPDGVNSRVGINTVSPTGRLHVVKTSTGCPIQNPTAYNQIVVENCESAGSADLQFLTSNNAYSHIFFGDTDDPNVGITYYDHSNNSMGFVVNASERFTIKSTGAACFACELTAKSLGTNDLILNNLNHDHANYVDGTRGSWLIQEGACDLFIINQVSCKKYKFNLIEIE